LELLSYESVQTDIYRPAAELSNRAGLFESRLTLTTD